MFKKLIRFIVTVLGGVIGYGIAQLLGLWMTKSGVDVAEVFQGQQREFDS